MVTTYGTTERGPERSGVGWRTACVAGLLGAASIAGAAFAEQRPPTPSSRPAKATVSAPATPAATAAKPRPAVPTDDADLDPANPPMLPSAPRAKMHACGREWQDLKRRGLDRDQTWKQFATACLQRG